ncbi:hypothetical protein DEU56DRAFT_761359 [Suillus clintonianus]|uniref:uncharacterized protein n=1 Tax=Suillus clintonianus TaxID=1904413 RepID=UPI001B86C48B|nr:uncharacterized protein DEU56DRAFT_761359 [Suillus clintonianus]KAG2117622.1 hypothetical protein DEU56DRAFT_761359 [Suillus clintonianus]
MPGVSWMTREQSAWLKTKVDAFRLSQLQGETTVFFANTSREWFENWPEAAVHFKDSETGVPLTKSQLSEEQTVELGLHLQKCRSKLRSYFYRSNSAAAQGRVTQFTKTITKLMGSTTARTRGPSAVEYFIQTEYKDNNAIKDEISSKIASCTQQNRMALLRTEATKAMTARGQEYVLKMEREAKAECELRVQKAKAEMEALSNPSDSAKLQCIEGLGGLIGQLLQSIHDTTGWNGSVYIGGPDPRVGGDLRVYSFHHGKGTTGLNFRDTLPDHHTRIIEPFTTFLKGAFAASVQERIPDSSPSSMDTIVPLMDTSVPYSSPSSMDTIVPSPSSMDTIVPSPSSIDTIVPLMDTTDFLAAPTATQEVPHASADQFFPINPPINPFSFHPIDDSLDMSGEFSFDPIPDDSLNLIPGNSFDLSNEALDNFLADSQSYLLQSTADGTEGPQLILPPFPYADNSQPSQSILSPPRFRSALARIKSKSPSGNYKKVPRPRPFRGGTGPSHGLYRDSPPPSVPPAAPATHHHDSPPPVPATHHRDSPSVPPAAPATHPSSLPPAETPPRATTAAPSSQLPADNEPMENLQPLDDIVNNQVRRSSRVHVPSTRTTEANNIGADGMGRKPRKSHKLVH